MGRFYTEEFKAQIIALKQAGHSDYSLRRRYRLGNSTISRWESEKQASDSMVKELSFPSKPDGISAHVRINELQSKLDKALSEIDILKTAVSVLCKKKG